MYKLMVIDDESIIREGIIKALSNHDTGFEIIGEAADGKEALELMPELLPDVIITDICMPLLNGIELIENANAMNPDVKILVISGHDNFDYAQNALRLGVYDYILKPVQHEKLLHTLQRVKVELDAHYSLLEDMSHLKQQISASLPVMREWFFHELITGKLSAAELDEKSNCLNLDIWGQMYGIALIKTKNFLSAKEKFFVGKRLLQGLMMQIVATVFPENMRPFIFFITEDKIALLISIQSDDQASVFIALNQNLKRVIILMQKYLNVEAYASLGGLYGDLTLVYHSYSEAEEAIQFSLLRERDSVVNYEDINTRKDSRCQRPFELERELLLQIKLTEHEKAQQTVKMILNYYREFKELEPVRLKLMVLETTVLIVRSVEEAGGTMNWGMNEEKFDPYTSIYHCETFIDLQKFLCEFTTHCINEIEKVRIGKGCLIIEKTKEIVEASFDNNEFSLNDVAARLFISPNYLRSLFKQQVKESFGEYLTRRRMERAQQLLDDASLKIVHIADAVGYIDQHYFSICFKKYFGLTPTNYREAKMMVK